MPTQFALLLLQSTNPLITNIFGFTIYTLNEFIAFKLKFVKTYANNAAELVALTNFKVNLLLTDQHNLLFASSLTTYTMGIWEYSDLSSLDMQQMMMGYLTMPVGRAVEAGATDYPSNTPANINYTAQGYVTYVGNQNLVSQKSFLCLVLTFDFFPVRVMLGIFGNRGLGGSTSEENWKAC